MKFPKKALVFFSLVTFICAFQYLHSSLFSQKRAFNYFHKTKTEFHTDKEVEKLVQLLSTPIDSGEYFLHSNNCLSCHGYDTLQYANIDAAGNDVNLYDDWKATMMANSARDPLWRAKVSHEILVNPSHAAALQDKCTSCHAPTGHYTSKFKGNAHYSIADLDADTLGLDGVSCTGCHTIGTNGLGNTFSGVIPYDTSKVLFGPFQTPITGPMQLYVGMTPTYSAHVSEGRFCSPCHTLITNTADLNGVATGKTFVEQATYHEWLNSSAQNDNVTCQNCHMPQISDSVRIANQYINLPPRSPFNKHKFSGGNTFMINLIKNNKSKLGISTPDKNFDTSLAANTRLLKYETLSLNLYLDSLTSDTAFFKVRLTNKAGHKFPSGYPSRRAVLQFIALGGPLNDTVFKSGIFNANQELMDLNAGFEPHYQIISNSSQVQVYEMIMGDVNGNKTTVLERADTTLKDNRLVPEGFSSAHYAYDTIKIVGINNDPDFNLYSGGAEGSGRDFVFYHVPVNGLNYNLSAYARMYYQSVPPEWLNEMFTYSSAPIDSFKIMYQQASKYPFLVDADSLLQIGLGQKISFTENVLVVFPEPSADGIVTVKVNANEKVKQIDLYSISGTLISSNRPPANLTEFQLMLPSEKGVYLVSVLTDKRRLNKKITRQ